MFSEILEKFLETKARRFLILSELLLCLSKLFPQCVCVFSQEVSVFLALYLFLSPFFPLSEEAKMKLNSKILEELLKENTRMGFQSKPEKRSMAWTNGAVQLKPTNPYMYRIERSGHWSLEMLANG